jgi:hypothetical protein
MEMFYAYEMAPAQTLSSHGDDGSGLRVFAPAAAYVPYIGYLPNAEYMGTPVEFTLEDYDGLWAYLDGELDSFMSASGGRASIYALANRAPVYYKHNFGIPLDDPRWDIVHIRLEGQAPVYDNGFVTLYRATAAMTAEEVNASRR